MKLTYINLLMLLCVLLFSCQKNQEYYEGIYIIGAEEKNPSATLTVDELPSAIGVNVAASCTVKEQVTVELKGNPELVEYYNKTFHKNYELLPAKCYKLDNTNLTIAPGKHASTDGLRLRITSRDELKEGVTYLLPISIENVSDPSLAVIEGSRTLYIVVNQIIITQAADLTPRRSYYKVDFRKESKYPTTAMKSLTFEARVNFRNFKSKWCYSIMGLEENLCMRTSGNINNGWGLQIGGGAGVASKSKIPGNKWVHVACVYNGDTGMTSVYIDGEFEGEVPDARGPLDLTWAYGHDKNASFYIGQSAADDRYMEGYISEARVWGVARSAAELKNNVCWVDPLSEGLIAYWRFNNENNEEEPKVVTDLTGNGYDAVYAGRGDAAWVEGVRCPDIDTK
ncbi:DUF1735 and LamG domain-containing protein [Bacteroides thetaiotaomicron]|uniref:DUF1735 and LamG domain-containing protein n=1 Tax=Bacteroides thetaiotaomicron TaxID=818 RepID=UPI0021665BC9|nr:DUF1735 and LamG domain-containing protein [Bacteroides thetaiotaomicron]MCS3196511.1 DUF1735 and LamG domain-containing protein [Bacteroides thetaiotaomicron]